MTRDQALEALAALLAEPARRLRQLGSEPLAIASAKDKFNDAYEDDYWCAVQLGRYHWEQSQFFGSQSDDGFGNVREAGTLRLVREEYGSAQALASDLTAARALLRRLDEADWHQLALTATGLPLYGGILALVIQFDQAWLHCSHPMGSDGQQIFALVNGKLLQLGVIDQRFDELVGRAELIACEAPNPAVVAHLSHPACDHFDIQVRDPVASASLAEMLLETGRVVDEVFANPDVEHPPVAIQLWLKWNERRYGWDRKDLDHRSSQPVFAIGDKYFDRNVMNILTGAADRKPKAPELLRERVDLPFEELHTRLLALDAGAIRRAFERASGTETFDRAELLLLLNGPWPYLLHRDRLYCVEDGRTVAVTNWRDPRVLESGFVAWIDDLPTVFRQHRQRLE